MVAAAAGAGHSHDDIAVALEISRNTLEKHFEHELHIGAQKKRMQVFDAMHRAAMKGNVAAMKAYLASSPTPAAPPLERAAEKKGKKQQQQEDANAAHVGTEWQDLLKPSAPLQ